MMAVTLIANAFLGVLAAGARGCLEWSNPMNKRTTYARQSNFRSPRMWLLILYFLATPTIHCRAAQADDAVLVDATLAIPPLRFDSTGALLLQASATSSQHDFDYLVGTWRLRNRKLKSRLTHSTEWIAFESRVEMHQILNGLAT